MTDLGQWAGPMVDLASRRSVGPADSPQTAGFAGSPRQTAGSADTSRQTAESADSPRQTARSARSADSPRQTAVSADTPRQAAVSADSPRPAAEHADTPRQTAVSADTARQTAGSVDSLRQTVGSADSPRQTAGSADSPRQTAGSADSLRPSAEHADTPRQTAGLAVSPPHTGGCAGSVASTPRPTAASQSDGALLVTVAAGWRVAGDQAAARAVRVASPHSARVPLQDWVDPSTCLLLQRDEAAGSGGVGQRPGLTVAVTPGHQLAIAEVALLSEFGRCEVFGDLGEYLGTEEAELVETVDDTDVLSLHHRCRLPVAQITLQCVSGATGRRQLWLYGLEVTLQPSAVRPAATFSLPAVLARLDASHAPLSEGAETLRAALAAAAGGGGGGPLSAGALAAALADRRRPPADSSGGQAQKAEPEVRTGGEGAARGHEAAAVPAWLESAVSQCVARLEERMWQRIGPRLDSIERKQDVILDRLDTISMRNPHTPEKSPD